MGQVLKIVGTIAVIAGLAIVTGGAALGLGLTLGTTFAGISAGALIAGGTLLSTAASLLSPTPKAPSVSTSNADRLNASINLRAPRTMVLGTTAMATDVRDQEWSTDNSLVHRFIVAASHKVGAIAQIWFDDKLAWTSAGGVTSDYAGYLVVQTVLEGSPANAINIGPRIGSARHYTGLAYVYLRFKLTGNGSKATSPFASTIPTRLTIVGNGALVYDPRLDSTVAGGAGSMRADDQSTWAWSDTASRNPALAMLWYLLGWRITNPVTGVKKLAVGKGIPPARLDLASFITAANLCDEPVAMAAGGNEPRYRCDGIFSEADAPSTVLDSFKATMNATLDDVDGRIRVTVLHNDLASPIGTLTADDVLGAFTWTQTPPLTDSINVIRGGYTDPSQASLFQLVDYPEVRTDSPDGIDRPQTVNLPLVQSASQAQRLVKTRLERAIFGGTFSATFQATAWKYQKGDVVRFSFYPLGWSEKLFRIADMAIQVDGTVPLMLREEDPAIYAWDASDAPAIVGAAPTVYDPTLWPILQGLSNAQIAIDNLSSDGVLDRGEKAGVIIDYAALVAQRDALDAQYAHLGSPAEVKGARDTAVAAMAALSTYLTGLQPAWNDTTTDTDIVAADYRSAWTGAYTAIANFGAAITGRAGLNGSDGLPGTSGADGLTPYIHYAYANSPDGLIDFDVNQPNGRAYEGSYADFTAADSTDPHAYVWREYKGPPFGMAARGYAVVAGNSVIKTGGANAWDSDAYSTVGFLNGCTLSFTGRGADTVMAGLNTDPTTDVSYTSLDFAWYLDGAGNAFIFESASQIPGVAINGYGLGTFMVDYDGRYVRYFYNGALHRTVDVGAGKTFYFDSSLALPIVGARINDISFTARGAAGVDGRDGLNGTNGTPGAPGVDGRATYLHTAYSDAADGSVNFTTGAPGARKYLGVLVDFTLADSTNPDAYDWSLIKGSDGLNGSNGTPGAPGANGQPTYVHIAYSNADDGSIGFDTADPTGRTYVGFYVDQNVPDSTNPAVYSWSLVKGADGLNGADGYSVDLTVTTMAVACDYLGNPKSGELPKYSTMRILHGAVDVTGAATITAAASTTAITKSVSGAQVALTGATADGYIDVTPTIGALTLQPKRITVKRILDNAPPSASGNSSGSLDATVSATSYDGTGVSNKTLVITTSSTGNLSASAGGTYYAPVNNSATTSITIAAKMQYRPVGGSSWSDFGSEVSGDQASYFPNDGPSPGDISLTQSVTGLAVGANYEVRFNGRVTQALRASGTAISGGAQTVAQA